MWHECSGGRGTRAQVGVARGHRWVWHEGSGGCGARAQVGVARGLRWAWCEGTGGCGTRALKQWCLPHSVMENERVRVFGKVVVTV